VPESLGFFAAEGVAEAWVKYLRDHTIQNTMSEKKQDEILQWASTCRLNASEIQKFHEQFIVKS